MPITVTMPQLGESVVEGVIARWLKQEGDPIDRDEPLVEIMTDKVNAELPSTTAGRLLRIIAQEGETVAIGAPLAEIAPLEEGVDETPTTTERPPGEAEAAPAAVVDTAGTDEPLPSSPVAAGGVAAANGVMAPASEEPESAGDRPPPRNYSPLVRRLAQQYDVPLDQLSGTGLGGRVTRDDVLAYLAQRGVLPAVPSSAPPAAEEPMAVAGAVEPPASQPAQPAAGADEEILPLTPLRRAIAEHMVRSKTTAPHATTVHEVDMTRLVRWREAHKEAFRQRYGVDITFLTFIVEATGAALKEFPTMNSSWGGDTIILKKQINIGVAVALEQGLIVPVIHRADEKSQVGLARAVADLGQRARANQLRPADVQGGTFTVNNVGVFGSIISTPIINQPQAAILSAHAITRRVVALPDDAIAVRSMMYLSLSFDHRIVDGMTACRFVQRVCAYLEQLEPSPVSPA